MESSGQSALEWQVEISPTPILLQFGGKRTFGSIIFVFNFKQIFFSEPQKEARSKCFELCRSIIGQNLSPVHSFKKLFLVEKTFFFCKKF